MLKLTADKNSQGQQHRLRGNAPLLLDDPQTVWLLQSGAMAVFTVRFNDGVPDGARHYLFTAAPGEALFGTAPYLEAGEERSLLAVALEETELLQLSLETPEALALNLESEAALLETWIHQLGSALVSLTPPPSSLQAAGTHYLSLVAGQTLQAKPGTVSWVQLQQGQVRWLGMPEISLDAATGLVPLGTGMWLEAEDTVELATADTTAIESFDLLLAGLSQLHARILHSLVLLEQQALQAEFLRFQEREGLNQQVTEAALGDLVSVLHPQSADFRREGPPLLVAAGAVGKAMGIEICPPARSEDFARLREPLEAIARASRIRTRRVLLLGNWWQRDNGPLLAYTRGDQRPVALLPTAGSRYEQFDPVEYRRTPVNAQVAEALAPEAYMFYRPLSGRIKQALDLFKFGVRGHERDLFFVILAGLAATLLGMLTPQATAILIDNAIPDGNRGLILQIGLALFAVAFGQAAFGLARGILTLRVETAADSALQPAVWDSLLRLRPSFFRQYSSGDIQSRVLAVGQIRRTLSGATQRTLFSGVFALLNLGLMFVYSWQLALIASALAAVAITVTTVSSRLILRKTRILQQMDGVLLGLTVELINGVAKLRVAAAEGRAFAYWARQYSQQKKLKAAAQRINDSLSVFNETLPTISSVLLFWFAILFMQQAPGQGTAGLTAGSFLAFNAAFGIFISGATSLSNTLTDVLAVVPLWERAQTIVQAEPEVDPSMADPGRLTGRVALEHITFRYREDGPLTLDDVSVHAEPGEFIALVGPSGSGKSTVFRLLLGFETPASGTVYYDGQDLNGLDVTAVRRQLGVVLQNGRINTGSIFELITGGALISMDEAWEAAYSAGFADDIKQMPMGMHTVISEGATNLSGGQRQRLLIARALVLKPKLILMDEATSALDNRTQSIVTESLSRMQATRVVIAHRLSTIRNADRIYVIEAGRVMQVGTFDELVKQEGTFARLAARQLE
ncbi:NHLP bacteriocin export ABC transporter permease/ATPase subunit [Leptolyngbya sp. FACHB-261]|uniref:NHLP bacteriocin export ABC transporter permease/ATPase subunit n=1 Tax=Leptolyngbya sp. FACHB-261 TaxID=2692806 RepID=UPI001686757C|nr:NHLP bacteriocin export ABC transporter permease/ATPase subunit [Leptolyngbya sp. FACHB-261]MBD2104011.1 NHLP bacteriocin export ABC transporter permease/ATPase subunit [Leptolyngbya sp. FACHB-261]